MSKRECAYCSCCVLTSPQEAGLLLELNWSFFVFIAEPLILLFDLGGISPEACGSTWCLGGRLLAKMPNCGEVPEHFESMKFQLMTFGLLRPCSNEFWTV